VTGDERAWLDAALLALIAARGSAPEGQGWYVSATEAEIALLEGDGAPTADLPPFPPAAEPLAGVIARLGLSATERLVIAAVLAGELDARYGKVYGFLQDDLTRPRPSLQICLWLADLVPGIEAPERVLLDPRAPLYRWGLVQLESDGRPRTSQAVALDPELLALLAGVPGEPPPRAPHPPPDDLLTERLAAVSAPAVVHFHGSGAGDARRIALAACAARDVPLHEADLSALPAGEAALRALYRRVLLHGAALHLTGFDALDAARVRELAAVAREAPCVTTIESRRSWAPGAALDGAAFVPLALALPGYEERRAAWRAAVPGLDDGPAGQLAARFRLTAGAIAESAAAAAGDTLPELSRACESDGRDGLGGLARLITPRATWDDLVLPAAITEQLHDLCDHVRHHATVLHEWGFDHGASRGTGLVALFLGASGTGKTLAAEVVAGELETELVHVDLAAVVSKYIGETEKNLERVLSAGDRSGAILFFDEADALFGKRSEAHDAHDRYANLELSFLLQRLEQYEGVAILASNFAQNIDSAFMRRVRLTIELPFPDEETRRRLWRVHLPEQAPVAPDVDPAELARALKLAGGGIRKVAVNAAFLAAADGGTIELAHVLRAARREYERAGRPFPGLEVAA